MLPLDLAVPSLLALERRRLHRSHSLSAFVPRHTAVVNSLLQALLGSPNFDYYDDPAGSYPFGLVLYYFWSVATIVILLNVLVALFSSSCACSSFALTRGRGEELTRGILVLRRQTKNASVRFASGPPDHCVAQTDKDLSQCRRVRADVFVLLCGQDRLVHPRARLVSVPGPVQRASRCAVSGDAIVSVGR